MSAPRLRPRLAAPLLILAIGLFPAVSRAGWPVDPNNGNVALCIAASDQSNPMIVSDGAGGAIVTWFDFRNLTAYDIYAQRVNAAGVPQWTANGVAICSAVSDQYYPTIVSDGAGGAIITWFDVRAGNDDIYAQRVNASGVPQWTANGVPISTAPGNQDAPTITSDGAAGAIIAWYDFRSGSADIYTQRVNASGVPQWAANGVVVCSAAGNQIDQVLVPDAAGGAILAWRDLRSGNYDLFAQRVNSSGALQWIANGVAVCAAAGDQLLPNMVTDGAGGAILAWTDYRSGNEDIYAQRLTSSGGGLWTANGVALCTATGGQTSGVIATDGAGGGIVAWTDNRSGTDIYGQRVSAGGVAQWTSNGVAICIATSAQTNPTITSDGSGGAIVAWQDPRSATSTDIYAQRVTGAGSMLWTVNGVAVSTAVNNQTQPMAVADGAGGAIVTWADARGGAGNDIYVQRVERFGQLGNPEATIASVRDVRNDQGGVVKVSWNASYLDSDPIYGVSEYRLWRSAPQALALAPAFRMRRTTEDPDEAAASGKWLIRRFAATDYAWELVGTQAAAILPSYSLVSSTTSDSVAGSNPRTPFMVEARAGAAFNANRWFSTPDSGYSVDNLGPVIPAPFAGTYSGGSSSLHWGSNSEADLDGYRLYRGGSPGFTPGPGTLVTSQSDTGYVDAAGAPYYYKLSAVDIHGNESGFALASPSGTSGVPGGESPIALRLGRPAPNPARGEARIDFDLPRASSISLVVHDLGGRAVRVLFRGTHDAGRFTLPWDLRDDAGEPVPGGVYFIRLEGVGRSLAQRVVAMP